jgi:hypothetical protein
MACSEEITEKLMKTPPGNYMLREKVCHPKSMRLQF